MTETRVDAAEKTDVSVSYSVIVSLGRRWEFRRQWTGWKNSFTVGFLLNFSAPALRVYIAGLSIWVGRIPKETVISEKQIIERMKEK